MPSRLALICLLSIVSLSVRSYAADTSLTLHADRVLHSIDQKVYGHFLEHIYHSCNGGLWGDLVWDRSFEGGGAGTAWSRQDDGIAQEGGGTNVRLVFGDPAWTDYEFTLEACKTGGQEGFLVLARVASDDEFYWANLGGWGNAGHALERGIRGQERWGAVTPQHKGVIEAGHWYRIRLRCEGRRTQLWLDDQQVIDYTDDGKGPLRGRVGIGTWATQARFRQLRVTSLDGRQLFAGLPDVPKEDAGNSPSWRVFGSASVSTSTENPLNGHRCKLIENKSELGGLAQSLLCLRAQETYRGSLWARGQAEQGLVVRLLDGEKVLAEQTLAAPTDAWREYVFELLSTTSTRHGTLQVGVREAGQVWLDQVSMMPESWRAAGGFRPDLLQAIADLQPPVIRWPGGCFASPYRWKDGIGPQHKRGPHPITIWDDKEVNSLGTDEFVAMCRRVGAEPLIVVNIGTPTWNPDVLDNDFLQEVLDWIEYCNGPADSTWGRVRAANGHPEPYGVKYWEIDNETWHMTAAEYAEWVNRFATAMRQADSSIKLAACGSAGYGDGGNGLAWNRVLIEQCADKIDYLSIHHYEDPNRFADGPGAYEAFFRRTGELIARSKNPNLKIYVSEWNAQSTDWRTGLYCGGLLNAFERCGDYLEIGGPALFLRHVSATDWDNAFVNFDQCSWFPAPNYVVMKLWREHYAPNRVALDGDLGTLNAVATRSADGKTLYLKLVNPSDKSVAIALDVRGATLGSASLQVVAPGSLADRNTLESPDHVSPKSAAVNVDGQTVRFTLAPLACGVLEMQSN